MKNNLSTKARSVARVKIDMVQPMPGALYEIMGEDQKLVVSDAVVAARTSDGRYFIHNTYVVKGFVRDPNGMAHPNRSWLAQAERFCARVRSKGTIDLAHWTLHVPETMEEREAYNLRCEADEGAWGA